MEMEEIALHGLLLMTGLLFDQRGMRSGRDTLLCLGRLLSGKGELYLDMHFAHGDPFFEDCLLTTLCNAEASPLRHEARCAWKTLRRLITSCGHVPSHAVFGLWYSLRFADSTKQNRP